VSDALVETGRAALAAAYLRTGDYDAVDAAVDRALAAAESDGHAKTYALPLRSRV
jgi:hypothetical protein